MLKKVCRKSHLFPYLVALALVIIALPAICGAMVMSPHRIILNAECVSDNNQDIQAIIPYSGAVTLLDKAESTLFIDGVTFEAVDVDYCYIDDNFLISFDREAIQEHFAAQEIEDEIVVPVAVEVSFYVYMNDELVYMTISGESEVEIVSPGNKK